MSIQYIVDKLQSQWGHSTSTDSSKIVRAVLEPSKRTKLDAGRCHDQFASAFRRICSFWGTALNPCWTPFLSRKNPTTVPASFIARTAVSTAPGELIDVYVLVGQRKPWDLKTPIYAH